MGGQGSEVISFKDSNHNQCHQVGIQIMRVVNLLSLTSITLSLLGATGISAQEGRGDNELESVRKAIRTRTSDSIAAISNPQFVSVEEAESFLNPADGVIGVHLRGIAKAYPIKFLDGREVVNDSLGSDPIAVTW